jgi:hypothetical protein
MKLFIAFYVVYFYIEDTVSITETARIAQLCDWPWAEYLRFD